MSTEAFGDDREKHYRILNNELKEKNARLMQEANDLINNNQRFLTAISVPSPQDISPGTPSEFASNLAPIDEHAKKVDLDKILDPISKLGNTAKTRYLAAKVNALEAENEKLQYQLATTNDEFNRVHNQLQEAEQEKSRLQRQIAQNTGQLDRLKVDVEEAKKRATDLVVEKTSLVRDLESGQREKVKVRQGARAADARLQRALEDIEKLRHQVDATRAEGETVKRQVHHLSVENRRLERQKLELIAGFKKQLKLIDVLRRQKMLTEASRALKITEEEFLKTLDWQLG